MRFATAVMKRTVGLMLCICLCLPGLTAYAIEPMSIVQLRESTPNRWIETYQNSRGESIFIDAPITTPQVLEMPVLRVREYPQLSDDYAQRYLVHQNKEDKGRWTAYSRGPIAQACHDWDLAVKTSEINVMIKNPASLIPFEKVEWDKVYPENSSLTVSDAYQSIQDTIEEVYTTYGTGYYPMEISRVETTTTLRDFRKDPDGIPLREKGSYQLYAYQTMEGIPIIEAISTCFSNLSADEEMYSPKYYAGITDPASYWFYNVLYDYHETLYNDIPLISFESAKQPIEKLIEQGLVRKVHTVRLGYMVYNENRKNPATYCLIPTWCFECDYYTSSKRENITPAELQGGFYQNASVYKIITVNAQTGELNDPESKDKDRTYAPYVYAK